MLFVSYNGTPLPQNTPIITADNSSFKWGDGLFETIKVLDGSILLEAYHFDRLKNGLEVLQIQYDDFFIHRTRKNIYELCRSNNCLESARVRLAICRNSEDLAETIIQVTPLKAGIDDWNEKGWSVGIFNDALKSLDTLSHLKTASYLPYVLAARHARKVGWDESFLLNSKGAICDGAKTNVFIINKDVIYTPSLEEGCVAGVMRRHVITELTKQGVPVVETSITRKALLDADEVFVTNAIIGIKWILSFENKRYDSKKVFKLYQNFLKS